jgi:hypothetical protein
MNAGPLVAIVVGLIITAAGILWQVHLARGPKPASVAQAPAAPAVRPEPVPLPPQPQPGSSPPAHAGPSSSVPDRHAASEPPTAPLVPEQAPAPHPAETATKAPATPVVTMLASADMSDAQFKSATMAFAEQMKAFEQSYDSRRLEILDKRTDSQSERDQQIEELKALQNDKVSDFARDILPHAQFLQSELARRLQLQGIGDVPLPPPPAGISIAMGRQILQMDVSDVGLPGHRPVTGLASYLELLASKLPD